MAALLAHYTSHFVKHLDAAEAEELLKDAGDRNQPAIDWSAETRTALAAAEADGRLSALILGDQVSS